jgi:hypothetical protein
MHTVSPIERTLLSVIIPYDFSALHHEFHVFQDRYIFQRIAHRGDHVCECAWLQSFHSSRPPGNSAALIVAVCIG